MTIALVAGDGLRLLIVAAVVLVGAAFALGRGLDGRPAPSDQQVARLIEERDGGLDDVLATAVDYAARPDASPRMREALFTDATRALSSRGLPRELDRVISRESLTRRRQARAAVAVAGSRSSGVRTVDGTGGAREVRLPFPCAHQRRGDAGLRRDSRRATDYDYGPYLTDSPARSCQR